MKLMINKIKKIRFSRLLLALWVGLTAISVNAQDEGDSTAAEKPGVSLGLRYTEANNKTKILEAIAKTKNGGAWQGIKGIPVHFYRDAEDPANLLGDVTTDNNGRAVFILPGNGEKGAASTYVATTDANDQFDANSEEITVSESSFEMVLAEEDSVRQVHLSLHAFDEAGNEVPVGEVEVHLFVKRLFGLLPLSDDPETTDENGEVTADFPAGIPGDTAGNLIVVARIEDHETFGNLEFSRKVKWGTPLIIDPDLNMRQLWSSRANAPIYLIVIINSLLIGIWGVILYIVYQAYKISKIKQH